MLVAGISIYTDIVRIITTGVTCAFNQELVAGYIIQATEMMGFEEDLRTGVFL